MEFTAQQIADYLKGTIEGDPAVIVHDFSKIEEGKPGTLSFLSNPKYTHYIYDCNSSIILVNNDFQAEKPISATLIRVENAYQSLAVLMGMVEQFKPKATGISSMSEISDSALIGENLYLAPFTFIGKNVKIGKNVSVYSHCSIDENVIIGDNVTIYPGVTIYKSCSIGNNCIIHSGAVIGSDGFGFAPTEDGTYQKIPQTGNVIIEDDVEIGANTVVDRATLGATRVAKGVKIDNLVQIAHNVEVGENTVIAAQTGIAGSSKIGKQCMFGGQVGISGHLNIADGTILGAQAGVASHIKTPGQIMSGYPAMPMMTFRKSTIIAKSLPEMQKLLFDLQKKVEELENKIKTE